jgi:hypothetical protein
MLLESRIGLSETAGFLLWDHKTELKVCRLVYVSNQQGEKVRQKVTGLL